jgi:hypothetical protein
VARLTLLRRRQVLVPTLLGWAILLAALALVATVAVRGSYAFLAVTRPVPAQILVIEGWLPNDQLDQALAVYRTKGGFARIFTTGGPISEFETPSAPSYAERARNYLVAQGVPSDLVVAVPAPPSAQDRSFLNAVTLREFLARSGQPADALDVVSVGAHCRRSWLVYRLAFGDGARVGMIAVRPTEYDPDAWWRTSAGAKDVLGEWIGWAWTALFFHPGARGSHEEMWGAARP